MPHPGDLPLVALRLASVCTQPSDLRLESRVNTKKDPPFTSSGWTKAGKGGCSEVHLTVIAPVWNGAHLLRDSLAALLASDLPRSEWELIVVDDSSSDDSALVAGRYADQVIRLQDTPRGPAHARNIGAELARGSYLVFLDADIRIHSNALSLIRASFYQQPELGAVFGAYDTAPAARGIVSQYRNLLHHYVHSRNGGEADTFWAGLGAVRAEIFRIAGGFDAQRYPRPQIEDIELGHRIRDLGYRILLRPDIQGTHLKRWTLGGMIVTDVRDRGVPWMRLLRQRKASSYTLNLRPAERVYTTLTAVACLSLLIALLSLDPAWLILGIGCAGIALAGNWPLLAWFAQERGWWFTIQIVPLRLLYYMLNVVSVVLGLLPPPARQAHCRTSSSRKAAEGKIHG